MRISDWSSDVCSSALLAAGKFALDQRPFEPLDMGFHPRREFRLVEHVRALGRDGAAESFLRVERHWLNTITDRAASPRSEEHTSELQSLMRISYAVFCLKKKTKNKICPQ